MRPDRVAAAVLEACRAELRALKPGNVHLHADGHDMTTADFEASAAAIAPVLADPDLGVGARILHAVERTRAAVGCNTNLGIVLLCAPLAHAALEGQGADLRRRLEAVLGRLDVRDAEFAFRAIRLAAPGGLGDSPRHDVRDPATVDLRAAMAEARDRDRIALQYANGFADVFELGVPRLRAARARWDGAPWAENWAVTAAYLGFLAGFPDSHVARKFGASVAEDLRTRARPLDAALRAADDPRALEPELLALDAALKRDGVNPGTSADLTVASLLACELAEALGHAA